MYLIFECIHFICSQPPKRSSCPVIQAFGSCTEGGVDEFERVVAIHGSENGELELRFVGGLVETGRADIFLIPGGRTAEG